MNKPICFRVNKLLLKCMLIMGSRFATFVATDLWRAFGERMRKRACVHVLWVACVREFAGDSAATGVRHYAGINDFFRVSLVSLSADCVGALVRLVYLDDVIG